MKKEKKATPEFKTEVEEQQFWSTQDSTDYLDWEKAEITIFPNLRPTLKTISLRLPEPMLNRLKQLVDERYVPISLKDISQGTAKQLILALRESTFRSSLENLWEKYHQPLHSILKERDAASVELSGCLKELGYE